MARLHLAPGVRAGTRALLVLGRPSGRRRESAAAGRLEPELTPYAGRGEDHRRALALPGTIRDS
jgi:hypothetical protein